MKQMSTMRHILRYLKPYWFYLVCTIVLAVFSVAAQLCIPYLVGRGIDTLLGAGAVQFEALYRIFVLIGVCIAVAAAAQWLMSLCNNRIAYSVLADIRSEAFGKLGTLPLSYLDARAYGETASVIISDAEQFSDGLLLGFTQLFTGVATILGVLVIMFVMRWEVALAVVLVTPLSFFIAKYISTHTYAMFKRQAEARAAQTAFIDEAIGNLKVVKAFSHEKENEEQFAVYNDALSKASVKATFFSSTTNPTTRFVNSLAYALVALIGAFIAIATAGSATPFTAGQLSSMLSYCTQYTKPFNDISEVVTEFQNAIACAARIFALIAEEDEPSDAGNEALSHPRGEVCLRDVSFSYRPGQKLIEHLSVDVAAGKRVAIVGPTGCGKTTLINLLMRFYDVQGGSITVDGKDIRTITRRSLRAGMGMVLQDTWLKRASVRENLCMGAQVTEEEMIAAARAAHAHSFIRRLPQGYDTVIGDEGVLSQGQKQLLCIARVMLCHPPMLILDEATSNIDTRTERKVQDAFQRLMEGRTCFIVAHRLSTIENADLILVMKDGKIIEQGVHGELLRRGGFYAKLYHAQFME